MQLKTVRSEVNHLSTRLDQVYGIINNQQKFLEALDARERRRNLILYGLQEENNTLGLNDIERVQTVLKAISLTDGFDPRSWEMRRLVNSDNRKKGPLWIAVDNQGVRNVILEKAKKLKETEENLSTVYIKKDLHPAVRREMARLREHKKRKKKKSEIVGEILFMIGRIVFC